MHISNLVTIMHASLNIFHMNFNEILQRLQDTPTDPTPTVAHYRPSPVALCMSLTRFATATASRTESATATLQLQLATGPAEKYAMKICANHIMHNCTCRRGQFLASQGGRGGGEVQCGGQEGGGELLAHIN